MGCLAKKIDTVYNTGDWRNRLRCKNEVRKNLLQNEGKKACAAVVRLGKRYPAMVVVAVLEILIVLWFVASLSIPTMILEVPLQEFATSVPAGSGVEVTEEEVRIPLTERPTEEAAPGEEQPLFTLRSGPQTLTPGAYLVTVEYTTDSTSPGTQAVEVGAVNDTLTNLVTSQPIALCGGQTSAQGRVWVAFGSKVDHMQVEISVLGGDAVRIQRIVLREQRGYRWVRLLGTVLLLGVLDWLLWQIVAAKESTDPALRHRQKVFWCLAGISLLASLPFLSGVSTMTADDLKFHLVRIANVARALQEGQFPVRLLTDMLNGYGYATPLYYCDLFLYLPAVLYNWMLPLQLCYQIYVITVTVLTVGVCYYSLRKIGGQTDSSLVCTAVYTLSAYRLNNVMQRAAVGEYTAMLFLPLVLWGMVSLYTREKPRLWDAMPLVLGMAGLLMCHVLSLEITFLFLVIFALVAARKTFKPARLVTILQAGVVTIGLGLWFLLPMIQSMLTQHTKVTGRYTVDFQDRGGTLLEMFSPVPLLKVTVNGVRSTLGAGLLVALLLVVWVLWQRRALRLQNHRLMTILGYTAGIGGVAVAFSLRCFPWNALFSHFEETFLHKVLGVAQFAWRYLSVATVLLCAAALVALELLHQAKHRFYKPAMACLLAGTLLYTGIFYVQMGEKNSWLNSIYQTSVADDMYVSNGEYELSEDVDYYYGQPRPEQESLQVRWYDKTDGVAHVTLENTGDTPASVALPIYDYGNYHAVDDGGNPWPLTTTENALLELTVPGGYAGTFSVYYEEPFLWRVAELISLLTAAGLLVAWWCKRRSQKLAGDLSGQ